jgi:hypothetical protein
MNNSLLLYYIRKKQIYYEIFVYQKIISINTYFCYNNVFYIYMTKTKDLNPKDSKSNSKSIRDTIVSIVVFIIYIILYIVLGYSFCYLKYVSYFLPFDTNNPKNNVQLGDSVINLCSDIHPYNLHKYNPNDQSNNFMRHLIHLLYTSVDTPPAKIDQYKTYFHSYDRIKIWSYILLVKHLRAINDNLIFILSPIIFVLYSVFIGLYYIYKTVGYIWYKDRKDLGWGDWLYDIFGPLVSIFGGVYWLPFTPVLMLISFMLFIKPIKLNLKYKDPDSDAPEEPVTHRWLLGTLLNISNGYKLVIVALVNLKALSISITGSNTNLTANIIILFVTGLLCGSNIYPNVKTAPISGNDSDEIGGDNDDDADNTLKVDNNGSVGVNGPDVGDDNNKIITCILNSLYTLFGIDNPGIDHPHNVDKLISKIKELQLNNRELIEALESVNVSLSSNTDITKAQLDILRDALNISGFVLNEGSNATGAKTMTVSWLDPSDPTSNKPSPATVQPLPKPAPSAPSGPPLPPGPPGPPTPPSAPGGPPRPPSNQVPNPNGPPRPPSPNGGPPRHPSNQVPNPNGPPRPPSNQVPKPNQPRPHVPNQPRPPAPNQPRPHVPNSNDLLDSLDDVHVDFLPYPETETITCILNSLYTLFGIDTEPTVDKLINKIKELPLNNRELIEALESVNVSMSSSTEITEDQIDELRKALNISGFVLNEGSNANGHPSAFTPNGAPILPRPHDTIPVPTPMVPAPSLSDDDFTDTPIRLNNDSENTKKIKCIIKELYKLLVNPSDDEDIGTQITSILPKLQSGDNLKTILTKIQKAFTNNTIEANAEVLLTELQKEIGISKS